MEDFKYLQGEFLLLPYLPSKVEFKDDTLVNIYNKLKSDGLYDIVFHDNPKMSLNEFINFFSSVTTVLSFFCVIRNGIEEPAGMCWLTDTIKSNSKTIRANGSFVFFREFQKPCYTNKFGKMALEFWFNSLNVNVIYGITPSLNRPALAYIKRVGFKESGRIPKYTTLGGVVCDGVITFSEAESFNLKQKSTRVD